MRRHTTHVEHRSQRARRLVIRLLMAGVAVGTAVYYRSVVRPWHKQWGATGNEVDALLPGDELVAEPADQITRAITIDATVEDVWPWIVQIGADRGGFYSYDWLENLFGLGIHSANEIMPEWQTCELGDVVFADADGSAGWYVMDVRTGTTLVLKVGDVKLGRPVRRDEALRWESLWTFALSPSSDGTTRLLVRERTAFDSELTRWVMAPIGVVSFVMTRKMMLGIKRRAERAAGRVPA